MSVCQIHIYSGREIRTFVTGSLQREQYFKANVAKLKWEQWCGNNINIAELYSSVTLLAEMQDWLGPVLGMVLIS